MSNSRELDPGNLIDRANRLHFLWCNRNQLHYWRPDSGLSRIEGDEIVLESIMNERVRYRILRRAGRQGLKRLRRPVPAFRVEPAALP
jgi:hypothetical protein